MQQKPAGVLGFHRWGSNKSISLLHITHSTLSSKIRIINVTTGSAKRRQRRGRRGSPGVVDSFGLLLPPTPTPFRPPPRQKQRLQSGEPPRPAGLPAPTWAWTSAARGTRQSLSAYHGVGAVALQRRGEAHVAHREPGDSATHHVAAPPELPAPPAPLGTLRAAGGAEPGPAGADWPPAAHKNSTGPQGQAGLRAPWDGSRRRLQPRATGPGADSLQLCKVIFILLVEMRFREIE